MKSLKIVFMGTPQFAVSSLDRLIRDGHEIVGVITAPDKKGGRGMRQMIQSAVKKAALKREIPILQPTNLKDSDFIEQLERLRADLFVVVAFRMLPKVVWQIPRLGTINLHGSLLPKYRGAAPIHWAIIRGEPFTGLTTFKIQQEIDTGDIIDQVVVPIEEHDTTGTLHNKMMEIGAILLSKTVRKLAEGPVVFQKQNSSLATSAPKLFHGNTRIDFTLSAREVYNFIRGLSPWPVAWTSFDDKEVKIYSASIAREAAPLLPREIFTNNKNQLLIGTRDYPVRIESLKMSGKKIMGIRDFLNGYRITGKSVE